MSDQNASGKFLRSRGLGDEAKRARRRVGGFVDMEIELPAFSIRKSEQNVQTFLQARDHKRDRAKNFRSMRVDHRFDIGHMRFVQREIDRE